jgi:hypothetical protein
VNAKELLVQDGSQRESAERHHASIVNLLRIFMQAFQLEREEVCQVSAFVIPTEEKYTIGIPDLQ